MERRGEKEEKTENESKMQEGGVEGRKKGGREERKEGEKGKEREKREKKRGGVG